MDYGKSMKSELNREMDEFNGMTPKDALEEIKSLIGDLLGEGVDLDERVSDAVKRLSTLVDEVSSLDATVIRHTDDTTDVDLCPARQMAARLLEDDDCLSPDDYYKVEDYFTSILNGEEPASMPKINYLKCAAKDKVNLALVELSNKFDVAKEVIRDCKDEFVNHVVDEIEGVYFTRENDYNFPNKERVEYYVKSYLAYQEYCDKWAEKNFYKYNKKRYDYHYFHSFVYNNSRSPEFKALNLKKYRD